ncbi:ATP/GTP-binding protein [Humibacillus sp. DSM 29435]|uniref:HpcH/HpaI aldolase/citrate lyase family protein n=1 Tax=Humibacillus sp. DSM 29435 TaxID=1869167 RepID=UPI000872F65F|nr:HpcH/HpaI aldolase/citrate lyase family protein [Humibacillus sp. DSM 29435]OFE16153.1 ATP/GTP-binding protein [Humibacillus sp. DSM 29435]
MLHFQHLPKTERRRLFAHPPQSFDEQTRVEDLGMALGATLYMPATRPRLASDLRRQRAAGAVSSVVCLEDAIADADVPRAQANAIEQLRLLGASLEREPRADGVGSVRGSTGLPLTFIRVRQPEQIGEIMDGLGEHRGVLAGFVLPKFTDVSGARYLEAVHEASRRHDQMLLAMPVIESPEVVYQESRAEILAGVAALLSHHREIIPAVRIGATDLCAALGIRRSRELTIYDVGPVAEVIYDIVNVLGRADGTGFTITGPVWEYFPDRDRLFKPQLRQTLFEENHAPRLRHELISRDLDGLIREVVLDRANGLTGKTVVHPSHIPAVHALSVVSHEEHSDALDVVTQHTAGGGATASAYRNKMNEAGPHRAWASRVLTRARMFGVANKDISVVDLLTATQPAPPDQSNQLGRKVQEGG